LEFYRKVEEVSLHWVELTYHYQKEQVTFLQDTLSIYHQMLEWPHDQVEYRVLYHQKGLAVVCLLEYDQKVALSV
jgi:hypothetical protein